MLEGELKVQLLAYPIFLKNPFSPFSGQGPSYLKSELLMSIFQHSNAYEALV